MPHHTSMLSTCTPAINALNQLPLQALLGWLWTAPRGGYTGRTWSAAWPDHSSPDRGLFTVSAAATCWCHPHPAALHDMRCSTSCGTRGQVAAAAMHPAHHPSCAASCKPVALTSVHTRLSSHTAGARHQAHALLCMLPVPPLLHPARQGHCAWQASQNQSVPCTSCPFMGGPATTGPAPARGPLLRIRRRPWYIAWLRAWHAA